MRNHLTPFSLDAVRVSNLKMLLKHIRDMTTEECALHLRVPIATTTKTHLSVLYRKTYCHNQSEWCLLIRAVLG